MRSPLLRSAFLGLTLLLAPAGCGGGGGGAATAPPTSLSAPQGVTASADSSGSILVTWEPPSNGADWYEVEARVGQGAYVTVSPTPIPSSAPHLSFTTTMASLAAPELTELGFRVLAHKGSAPPSPSAAVSVRTPLLRPDIHLASGTDGIQTITLTNHSHVADSLRLIRHHSYDLNLLVWVTTDLGPLPVATTTHSDGTPPEGTTVFYEVIYSKGADSVRSRSDYGFAVYRPPSHLSASVEGQRVTLSWTNHSLAATKIVLLRNSGLHADGVGLELVTLPPNTQTWVDTVPGPGFYTYALEARTNLWSSPRTPPAMVVVEPQPTPELRLVSSIQAMPPAYKAIRGASGSWYFARDYPSALPTIHIPSGTGWTPTVPPEATSLVEPYLALGPGDVPQTVFLKRSPYPQPQSIRYGRYEGGAWLTEEIAVRTLDESRFPTITWTLDREGTPHLLWATGDYTQPMHLEYAHRNQDGTWAVETVTMPAPELFFNGMNFKFFVDDSGTPHALIADLITVQHLVRTGPGVWTWENLGDLGQGQFSLLPGEPGLGSTPSDFSLILQTYRGGAPTLCLLSKVAGAWQPVEVICPIGNLTGFTWARSQARDRMAFYVYAPEGTKVVVGGPGAWSSVILDSTPVSAAFPAFDLTGRLHVLCQVSFASVGGQLTALNVIYDEVIPIPPVPVTRPGVSAAPDAGTRLESQGADHEGPWLRPSAWNRWVRQ